MRKFTEKREKPVHVHAVDTRPLLIYKAWVRGYSRLILPALIINVYAIHPRLYNFGSIIPLKNIKAPLYGKIKGIPSLDRMLLGIVG